MHSDAHSYSNWLTLLKDADEKEKIFVCGCAKSGTTWLMNILSGHPEIIIDGEGRWGWTLAPIMFKGFDLFNEEHERVGGNEACVIDETERRHILRTVINSAFARYIANARDGKKNFRFVGDKTPQHTVCIPLLASVFPEARFINIVRDPRDAAVSSWFHESFRREGRSFEEHIRDYIVNVWPANVVPVKRAVRLLGGRVLEVRYEDLLSDERTQVKKILSFIGAAADVDAVAACREAGDFKKRSGGRKRGEQDEESFYRSGTAGDWEKHISPELARECCSEVSALLLEYGYEI